MSQVPGLTTETTRIRYFNSPWPEGVNPSKYCFRTSAPIFSTIGPTSSSPAGRNIFPPLDAASILRLSTDSWLRSSSVRRSNEAFFMPTAYTGMDTCCRISAISAGVSRLALSTPSVKSMIARFPFFPASILDGVAATASKRAVCPPASRVVEGRQQSGRVAGEIRHRT